MPDAARLFIALWPDRALRDGLAVWCRGCSWPAGARPPQGGYLLLRRYG